MSEADPNGKSAHEPGSKLDDGKNMVGLVMQGFRRALLGVSRVGTFGAKKYTKNGWKEVPDGYDRYQDALYRHLLAEGVDEQSGLPHLYHAAWNLLAMIELKEAPKEESQYTLEAVNRKAVEAYKAGWSVRKLVLDTEDRYKIESDGIRPLAGPHLKAADTAELRVPKPHRVTIQEEIVAKAIERWETAPQDWVFAFTAPMGHGDLEMDGVEVFALPVADVTKALNSLIHRNRDTWESHLRAIGIKACWKDKMRKFSDAKFAPSIVV